MKPRKPEKLLGKLCRLDWTDITGASGWRSPETVGEIGFAHCITYGVVLSVGDAGVRIASSTGVDYGGKPFVGDVTYVPWGNVESLWEIPLT